MLALDAPGRNGNPWSRMAVRNDPLLLTAGRRGGLVSGKTSSTRVTPQFVRPRRASMREMAQGEWAMCAFAERDRLLGTRFLRLPRRLCRDSEAEVLSLPRASQADGWRRRSHHATQAHPGPVAKLRSSLLHRSTCVNRLKDAWDGHGKERRRGTMDE